MVGNLRLCRGIRTQIDTSQSRGLRNSAIELMLAIFYHFLEFFQHLEVILSRRQYGLLLLLLGGVKRLWMWLMLLMMNIPMHGPLKIVVTKSVVARHLIRAVVGVASG